MDTLVAKKVKKIYADPLLTYPWKRELGDGTSCFIWCMIPKTQRLRSHLSAGWESLPAKAPCALGRLEMLVWILVASRAMRASSDRAGNCCPLGSYFFFFIKNKNLMYILGDLLGLDSLLGGRNGVWRPSKEKVLEVADYSPSCHNLNHSHWVWGTPIKKSHQKIRPMGISSHQVPRPLLGVSSIYTVLTKEHTIALKNPYHFGYAQGSWQNHQLRIQSDMRSSRSSVIWKSKSPGKTPAPMGNSICLVSDLGRALCPWLSCRSRSRRWRSARLHQMREW